MPPPLPPQPQDEPGHPEDQQRGGRHLHRAERARDAADPREGQRQERDDGPSPPRPRRPTRTPGDMPWSAGTDGSKAREMRPARRPPASALRPRAAAGSPPPGTRWSARRRPPRSAARAASRYAAPPAPLRPAPPGTCRPAPAVPSRARRQCQGCQKQDLHHAAQRPHEAGADLRHRDLGRGGRAEAQRGPREGEVEHAWSCLPPISARSRWT